MDAFRMMEGPSGTSGSAFCTVKRRPFTLMSKIRRKLALALSAVRRGTPAGNHAHRLHTAATAAAYVGSVN
jgi:hypothetical protein